MKKGHVEYGDSSWQRPVAEILDEMLEEFADVGGWGSIALSHNLPRDVRDIITQAVEDARKGYRRLKTAKMLLGMRETKQVHVRVDGPAGGSIELGHVEGCDPREAK